MPLDRQSIEKRDFPIGRRGYEPEAVDAFLAQLAGEVDALQRAQQRRTPESLAQSASDQVRAIVEAAESSAADIERAAEEEAAHIRSEAARDAERTRNEAIERARDHVGQVSEATATMLQRVTAMQTELDGLVESIRTGANRVSADLALLEGNMAELYTAAGAAKLPKEHVEVHAGGRSAVLSDFRELLLYDERRRQRRRDRGDKGHHRQLVHLREVLAGRAAPSEPDPLETMRPPEPLVRLPEAHSRDEATPDLASFENLAPRAPFPRWQGRFRNFGEVIEVELESGPNAASEARAAIGVMSPSANRVCRASVRRA